MAVTTRARRDGDPWQAQWTGPDGTIHNLYDDDVALLRAAADGQVWTDSRFPKWVYVGRRRCTTRDQENKTFRRLVTIGVLTAGAPERREPNRPGFSSSGVSFDETHYRPAGSAAAAILATLR